MDKITVTGFRAVPPFAEGLIRDLRVRWALEEAGLSFEALPIDIDDRKSDANRQRHPFGMVPAFEGDGMKLFETGAILQLIAEDCEALMPADRRGRVGVITWMFAALNTVEPPVVNLFAIDLLHGEEQWAKLRRPTAVDEVMMRLGQLSDWLEGRDYLLERFTAADILMATVLRFLRHTDLVASLPVLDAYLKRCEARPAFQKALREQIASYEPVAA